VLQINTKRNEKDCRGWVFGPVLGGGAAVLLAVTLFVDIRAALGARRAAPPGADLATADPEALRAANEALRGSWQGEEVPWPEGYRAFLRIDFYEPSRFRTLMVSYDTDGFFNGDPMPCFVPWNRANVTEYSYRVVGPGRLLVRLESRYFIDDKRGGLIDLKRSGSDQPVECSFTYDAEGPRLDLDLYEFLVGRPMPLRLRPLPE
jgi:hypothetical protein